MFDDDENVLGSFEDNSVQEDAGLLSSFDDNNEQNDVNEENNLPPTSEFNNEDNINEPDNSDDDETKEDNEDSNSFFTKFLETKGIKSNIVKIETEDGVSEVDFNELSDEEKLEILTYSDVDDLDEEEAQVINMLRENEMSFDDLANYFKQQGIKEYIENSQSTSIDDYSDDDIYVSDLKSRYPNFTDEMLLAELEKEKTNETLFKAKVDYIRQSVKEQEIEQLKESEKAEEEKKAELIKENIKTVVEAAKEVNEIGGFEIETDDIPDVVEYIYKPSVTGESLFSKDLSDPKKLFKIAFLAKNADRLFEEIHELYKSKIKESAKNTKVQDNNKKTSVKPKSNKKPSILSSFK